MTPSEITDALRQLGDNADDVALTLGRLGFTGHPLRCDVCPVANYLAATFPGHWFEVTPMRVQIDGEGRAETTFGVFDFMLGFDLGQYPHLVAPGAA